MDRSGLFHKAISMSGNALNPFWQMNRSYSEQVEVLAKEFKCPVNPRHAFVQCMKKIDAYQLGALHAAVQVKTRVNNSCVKGNPVYNDVTRIIMGRVFYYSHQSIL